MTADQPAPDAKPTEPEPEPRHVHQACHHLEIFTEPPEADVYVNLRILGWVRIGTTRPDTPVQYDYGEIVRWNAETGEWKIPEFWLGDDGKVAIRLGAKVPDYGEGIVELLRSPGAFRCLSDPPDALVAQGNLGQCPPPDPANTSTVTITVFPTEKNAIAWHYLKVYSDPPGAHIYNAEDNSYWGKTGLNKPVLGRIALPRPWWPPLM
jgi:hypothetical protein